MDKSFGSAETDTTSTLRQNGKMVTVIDKGAPMKLEKAVDTLSLLQFYLAAIIAADGEASNFELDVIDAIETVKGAMGL